MLQKTESIRASSPVWNVIGIPLARIIVPVLFIGLGIVAAQLSIRLLGLPASTPLASILSVMIAVLAVYSAYRLSVQWIEKRPVAELSLRGAAAEVSAGLLAGLILISTAIGILGVLGIYRVTGMNPWVVMLPAVVANIPSGFVQEILFRGILFRVLEEYLGTWIALGLSALVFGLVHLFSAHATLWGALTVMLEAGLLLAAAYILTRRLWLAIGIHVAWDFALDGIFGVGASALSGGSVEGILRAGLSGPELLTGGQLGVEGSLISVLVVLLAAILMLRRAYRKGGFVLRLKERK